MSREPLRRLFAHTDTLRNAQMGDWDGRTQREVDVVSDAFLMTRKLALEQVGSYDERFLLYFTEDDLCMRLKRAGYGIFYNPATAVRHLVSCSTLRKPRMFILKIQRDDLVRYFWKYDGAPAALIAWVAGTFELFVWWLYLLFKRVSRAPEKEDARV